MCVCVVVSVVSVSASVSGVVWCGVVVVVVGVACLLLSGELSLMLDLDIQSRREDIICPPSEGSWLLLPFDIWSSAWK